MITLTKPIDRSDFEYLHLTDRIKLFTDKIEQLELSGTYVPPLTLMAYEAELDCYTNKFNVFKN